ncbi:hypothetical protein ACHAXT_006498 [Thalassiosira profunda]
MRPSPGAPTAAAPAGEPRDPPGARGGRSDDSAGANEAHDAAAKNGAHVDHDDANNAEPASSMDVTTAEGGASNDDAGGNDPSNNGKNADAGGAAGDSPSNDTAANEGHRPQQNTATNNNAGEASQSADNDVDGGNPSNDGGNATTDAQNAGEGGGQHSQSPPSAAAGESAAGPSADTSADPSAADPSTADPSTADPAAQRDQALRAAIAHRRHLLSYIRHTRSAAESVRDQYSRGERRGFVAAMIRGEPEIPTQGEGGGAPTPPKKMSSEQAATYEIADFKTVTQMAARSASSLKLLKRKTSGGADAASQRDLRKGDKVGKKMTAAVGALTNAGGWASTSSSEAPGNNSSSPGKGGGALKADLGKQFHKPPGTKTQPGEKPKKSKKRKGSQVADGAAGPGTRPLHATGPGGGGALPPSARVPSAAAVQLLERREGLLARLDDALQRRNRGEEKARADDGKGHATGIREANKAPRQRPLPQRMPHPAQPSRLPPRRQTAWDRVLDEMSCVAADFHGERKWKMAAGRSLSAAISQHKPKKRRRKLGSAASSIGTPASSLRRTGSGARSCPSTPRSSPRVAVTADGRYAAPSAKDVEAAGRVAHALGVAVLEYWEAAHVAGAADDERDCRGDTRLIRRRLHKLREGEATADAQENISADAPAEGPRAPRPQSQELGYDEITRRMAASLARIASLKTDDASAPAKGRKKSAKSSSTNVGGVELDEGQLRAVRFLERVWEAPAPSGDDEPETVLNVAGIVGGGFGFGKTVAACALLWRHRGEGPQVVVCSRAAVMRWRLEVAKFDGLKAVEVDGNGRDAYGESDVLVCDYASFREWAANKGGTIDVASLILDLRRPSSAAASPVQSAKWWASLNKFVAASATGMHRLVVEQTDFPPHRLLAPPDHEGGKHSDGLLAMKVAFVHHPSLFRSERASIGKRVVSWAKREAKATATADGDSQPALGDGADSLSVSAGCRTVLAQSLQKFHDGIADLARVGPEDDATDSRDMAWEVRMCSLTKAQRDAYEQCCFNVGESEEEMADGLLTLRRIVLHADVDEAMASFLPLRHSEPTVDLAEKLARKSAKMSDLLRVLTDECGAAVGHKMDALDAAMDDDQREDAKNRSKVLILATLPEARLLASNFLSAVGLRHEVLVSSDIDDAAELPSDRPVHSRLDEAAMEAGSAWTWNQDILSRFNSGHVDILIASPKELSSHGAGVGVTSACTVISIDEDWSGREALHILSVLAKIERHGRGAAEDGSCKFIKLICEHTCEDTFLCRGNTTEAKPPTAQPKAKAQKGGKKKASRRTASKATPADEDAEAKKRTLLPIISVANSTETTVDLDGFLVPPASGSNIVRYRNTELSLVFCSEPPTGSESTQLFMPTNGSALSDTNVSFAQALLNSERDASQSIGSLSSGQAATPLWLATSSLQGRASVCRRSSLFEKGQGARNLHLLNQNGNLRVADAVEAGNADSGSNEEGGSELASGADTSSLLLYRLPTSERTNGREPDDLGQGGDVLGQSIFSRCFSSFNSAAPALIGDGNQGCDTLVYAPSFLPHLLQVIRNVMHATPGTPEESSGAKRKELDGQVVVSDSKRLRTAVSSESDLSPRAPDIPTSWTGPQMNSRNDTISIIVETNPHSMRGDGAEGGSVELLFNKRLLTSDLKGVSSCQSWPALNSMILITQKKQTSNANGLDGNPGTKPSSESVLKVASHAEKKSLHKKMKKQHQVAPHPPPPREKGNASYFRNDHLFGRSYSAREGIRPDFASSVVGQVGLQRRLDDLVSNSSSELPSADAGPSVLGAFPVDEASPEKRKWNGISLPVFVKMPKRARELSASLEESPEPWTAAEDALLQESLSRYGINWQLASDSVSSGTRRSPAQCQARWESLRKTANAMETNASGSNATSSPDDFQFAIGMGAREGSATEKATPSVWISAPQDAPTDSSSSQSGATKVQPLLFRTSLISLSKKRRDAKIPIPAAAPTHESHTEAIQAARASMLAAANGVAPPRHEMWPLELLDFMKKQTTAAPSQQQRQREIPRGSAAQHPPPQHPQGSMPVAVPVPVQYHPSQMYHAGQQPPYAHHPGPNNRPRMPRPHPKKRDQKKKGST